MTAWEVIVGDSLEVLAGLAPESVDAIVTDPPYGLEFMGREWDRFREDDQRVPGYNGRPAGALGEATTALEAQDHPAKRGTAVALGGGQRPKTSRCEGCGKRDQFRKPHGCPDGTNWRTELIDPHAAPPSMLAFQSWCREWARLALRALRPGGHLLAFGGTRTYHRLACAIEDAGFEIRDTIAFMHGQGFPKSLDVSKAIDAAAGATREVVGAGRWAGRESDADLGLVNDDAWQGGAARTRTAPATPDAERWQGWGTALKPAHEPIVVARKPLSGTVAANVLAHGTGALNVDGCRVGTGDGGTRDGEASAERRYVDEGATNFAPTPGPRGGAAAGRWPANVILDPDAAAMLDAQTGELHTHSTGRNAPGDYEAKGMFGFGGSAQPYDGDSGGASRFFYCAKASSAERNALDLSYLPRARSPRKRAQQDAADRWRPRARNRHPTVKPVELMRWLVRLVTPPGGLVVDPFAGSGTTGCAAMLERVRFLGVERDRGSAIVARARIAWWAEHPDGVELVRRLEAEQLREAVAAAGQEVLF